MAHFSREQVRRRRRIALGCLALVALLVFASCTTLVVRAVSGDGGPGKDGASGARGDDSAMTVPETPADAAIRSQLPKSTELGAHEVMGIDVSAHQKEIDWVAVRADGVSFAYLKATEGSSYTDPQYATNAAGAREAGVAVGSYHYFTLCSPGADQAQDFLATAVPRDDDLPPALDLEFDGNCDKKPEAERAQAEIDAFVDAVEKAWGRKVVVYASTDWRTHYGLAVTDERPDWLFSKGERPRPEDWAVWQVRFNGRVSGISGKVDIDVARIETLREQAELSKDER